MPRRTVPALMAAAGLLLAGAYAAHAAEAPKVIELTQTACQFLEPEHGVDRGYESHSKADCDAINARTADTRLAEAETMQLPAGKYVFRVKNTDVPYELGFWLREKDYDWRNPIDKLTKTSVSGGGLYEGQAQDYEVDLAPGEYLYSCPLNTTPNYRLVVTEK